MIGSLSGINAFLTDLEFQWDPICFLRIGCYKARLALVFCLFHMYLLALLLSAMS